MAQVDPGTPVVVVDERRLDRGWVYLGAYAGSVGGLTYCAFACSDPYDTVSAVGAITLVVAGVVAIATVYAFISTVSSKGG
ncbi:MAG: hypothetical protein AB7P03_30840 [Kofleriaceae bacterium]